VERKVKKRRRVRKKSEKEDVCKTRQRSGVENEEG
jgi:hypothetical protein